MPETFDDFFIALLFGEGAWLGLLIIFAIMIILLVAWKYSGVLLLPIVILLGITYIDNDLIWHAIVTFSSTIFMIWHISKLKK